MARPTISPQGALGRLLTGIDLTLVDIGARGETQPEFRAIAPFSHLVVCEPEAEEAARLEQQIRETGTWAASTVIPEALWSQDGSATLFVAKSPGLSSLRRPDPAVTGRYFNADSFETVAEVEVPTLRLDAAARRYGFETACLLKLDTQGTELEILQSGEEVLTSTLGVFLEANFRPFYTGQATFGEIDVYLRERGFELFDLHRSHLRAAGYDSAISSRRQLTWGHCLYLRNPAEVLAHGGEWPARHLAIALAYGHFDLALQIARRAQMPDDVVDEVLVHAGKETGRLLRRQPDAAPALVAGAAKDPRH